MSEMSPLKPEYTEGAVKRAEMLCKLCKRNALVSFEHLIQNELDCLSTKNTSQDHIYSFSGNWFPNITDVISPVSWIDGIKEVDEIGKSIGLNRQSRRAIRRKTFKNKKPREVLQQALIANKPDLSDLIARYPMREEDARILERYAVGQATKIQAEEAFFESLRDPVWMMKWFHSHSEKMSPIISWIRGPSEMMINKFSQLASIASLFLERTKNLKEMAIALDQPQTTIPDFSVWWKGEQDKLLFNLLSKLNENNPVKYNLPNKFLIADIEEFMPGYFTGINVMFDSILNSVGERGRKPKPSDWVDCIHATYAPYVDVFRTDSYMAPIVQNVTIKYGVMVVPKLENLVSVINGLIATRH